VKSRNIHRKRKPAAERAGKHTIARQRRSADNDYWAAAGKSCRQRRLPPRGSGSERRGVEKRPPAKKSRGKPASVNVNEQWHRKLMAKSGKQ